MIRIAKYIPETAPVLSIVWTVNVHGTILFKIAVDGKLHIRLEDQIEGWGEVQITPFISTIDFTIIDVRNHAIVLDAFHNIKTNEQYFKDELTTVDAAINPHIDWRNFEEYVINLPIHSVWLEN